MGFLSSLIGGVAGLFGANMQNSAQSAMQANAQAFNREVMLNRHQWEVADLKAAGLNPLLSATSPTGTLSSPMGTAAKPDIAQSAAALGQLSIQNKQAEAALNSAEANKISAEANKMNAETLRMKAPSEIGLSNAQELNARSQVTLNQLQAEWLPKLNQANLNRTEQDIANSILETTAKVSLMAKQGDAALISANAAASQATTAAMVGESIRSLNLTNEQLASVNIEKVKNIVKQQEFDQMFNDNTGVQYSHLVGTVLDNFLPILGRIKFGGD